MTKTSYKRYSSDFKQEVIAQYLTGQFTQRELARSFNVPVPTVNQWVRNENVTDTNDGFVAELNLPNKSFLESVRIFIEFDNRGGEDSSEAIAFIKSKDVKLDELKRFSKVIVQGNVVAKDMFLSTISRQIKDKEAWSKIHEEDVAKIKALQDEVAEKNKAISDFITQFDVIKKVAALLQTESSKGE